MVSIANARTGLVVEVPQRLWDRILDMLEFPVSDRYRQALLADVRKHFDGEEELD